VKLKNNKLHREGDLDVIRLLYSMEEESNFTGVGNITASVLEEPSQTRRNPNCYGWRQQPKIM
jgi:hypothetical protein